jgi:serine/threonine-protein kinase
MPPDPPGTTSLVAGLLARSPSLPLPGETIVGKYLVERVLGAGGMGVVVAARHERLGQRVAIKFVRNEAARDANAVARFLREARAAATLSSEHVAKVLDVGELEGGAPFMVMEYLAGVDLGEVLRKKGPLPIPEAIGAVLQACEALAEAHAMGIVHRDLKPSNLFVTKRPDGSPLIKVLDFGISKTIDVDAQAAGQGLTVSGSVMGTPAYMSPEQLRAPKTVDARTDIWALGVVLYELLTGKNPFAAEGMGETFARIVSEPAAPIRRVRPEVPVGLGAAIAQCLERRVQRRFQNVGVLASKLLPYAPPEAALSVERIVRIVGAATTTPGSDETATASGILGALPLGGTESSDTDESQPRARTDSAWQSSGPGRLPFRRRRARILVTGAAGLAIGAVAVGAWVQRGRIQNPTGSSTPQVQSSLAVPAPVVSSLAAPPLVVSSPTVPAPLPPAKVVSTEASAGARAPIFPSPEPAAVNASADARTDGGQSLATRVSPQSTPPSIRDATARPKLPIVNRQSVANPPTKPTDNAKDIF